MCRKCRYNICWPKDWKTGGPWAEHGSSAAAAAAEARAQQQKSRLRNPGSIATAASTKRSITLPAASGWLCSVRWRGSSKNFMFSKRALALPSLCSRQSRSSHQTIQWASLQHLGRAWIDADAIPRAQVSSTLISLWQTDTMTSRAPTATQQRGAPAAHLSRVAGPRPQL